MIFNASYVLAKREVVRFFRQRSRVMGAILTPVLFWLFLGYGFGKSFQNDSFQGGYQAYFFPGVLLMVLMFTSIFSMISLIEDRREGFLQTVLISPSSRMNIVAGKVVGTGVIAVIQTVMVSLLAPFAGFQLTVVMLAKIVLLSLLISFQMALFGFLLAWRSRSIQGFHVLMNLILMPMWMLSGATFPVEGASSWIAFLMKLNPLTYANTLLQSVFFEVDLGYSLYITLFLVLLFFVGSVAQIQQKRKEVG